MKYKTKKDALYNYIISYSKKYSVFSGTRTMKVLAFSEESARKIAEVHRENYETILSIKEVPWDDQKR